MIFRESITKVGSPVATSDLLYKNITVILNPAVREIQYFKKFVPAY